MAAEIELKLALDRSAVPRVAQLLRHPAIAAVRAGRARTTRLVSTYYDTPDGRLQRAGVALRIRRDGTRWTQTVKGPPSPGAGGGLHARDEHEWRLASPRIDPARLATTPWRKLFEKIAQRGELSPVFATDFTRRTLPLAFPDGTRAELAIDVGRITTRHPPSRSVPIAEIEIEIESGSAAPVFALALALIDDWPLSVATTSKAERGHALAHGKPDAWNAPVHAGRAAFASDGPAEDALRAIAFECLQQVAGNAPGLLADADPEWVHQMRIGTRRLRSCLSLIESIAGREHVAPIVAELRWLARTLGAARDWDVLATDTLPPLAAALAHDPKAAAGVKRMGAGIARHRSAARSAAREAVGSLRFQRLVLSAGALFAAPRFGARADQRTPAREFADALLARRHRKLLQCGVALEHGSPDERHAVRIAAKKLRYAAEFFSPPEPGKRNRAYLKALTRLQDALGTWNDAVTAARLASGLSGNADLGTIGAVRGWAAAQATALAPEIIRAWRRFAAAGRFWAHA